MEGNNFIDTFVSSGNGGLSEARDVTFGPNGDLFVVSRQNNSVMRYDGQTGAFISQFVSPGSGGLIFPNALAFDSQGNLYVTSPESNQVLRYDGTTGAFLGVFVSAGAEGMLRAAGVTFGPDGNIYVADSRLNMVLRFQGPEGPAPGSFVDVYALSPFTELGAGTNFITFGPDGRLYGFGWQGTINGGPNVCGVYRATGVPGETAEVFVPLGSGGLTQGRDLVFDASGNLLQVDWVSNSVLRYQGPGGASPGAFMGAVVPAGAGGLTDPAGIAATADGIIYVSSEDQSRVLRYGSTPVIAFTVQLDSPSATQVTVQFATVPGTALAGSDYVTKSETLAFAPGQTTRTILVETLNDALAESTETFTVILSNPVGATIADGTGAATITDDDATKFFVVDDASANATYRYGAPGNGLGSSTLTSANTAPRGAASTTAGDKLWVVDANKSVYIYSAAGALLGSWTAGSLAAQAQVEGITVWGIDVWLIDAKQDKVFRYAGAATLLSGSQNAASSFSLATGNKDPKDLVTDGTSIWVVNSSSTDKVFKYSLAGASQGSWTIDAANASPTGITLDPTGVSQSLWIVDNGTDRVYEYAAARSRTSGSQNASATFALAAGNTNPQGIADPPMANGEVLVSMAVAIPQEVQPIPTVASAYWFGTDEFDLSPIDVRYPRERLRRI